MSDENFVDERHALYSGWRIAGLVDSGVPVAPMNDEDDDHTPAFIFEADYGAFRQGEILIIGPPPEGWSLRGDADRMVADGLVDPELRAILEDFILGTEAQLEEGDSE